MLFKKNKHQNHNKQKNLNKPQIHNFNWTRKPMFSLIFKVYTWKTWLRKCLMSEKIYAWLKQFYSQMI